MGVHSLRHAFIMLCVSRQACGFRNATSSEMKRDARMTADTLERYLADSRTLIEGHIEAGENWNHIIGYDYRPMWLKNPASLKGVGKAIKATEIASFVRKTVSSDLNHVDGKHFLDITRHETLLKFWQDSLK